MVEYYSAIKMYAALILIHSTTLMNLVSMLSERKRETGKIYPFECRVPKNSR